jgi:hypothetical protein
METSQIGEIEHSDNANLIWFVMPINGKYKNKRQQFNLLFQTYVVSLESIFIYWAKIILLFKIIFKSKFNACKSFEFVAFPFLDINDYSLVFEYS